MPRQARIDAPGALHHIICRGLERRNIFRDDTDRDNFVVRLGHVLQQTSTRCFAWTLIPNHFHLLLETGTVPIATVMRRLLTGYAVCFNRRHCRAGHLFQNRYKSILCQGDTYLLELVRYIHLNPIRAGVVKSMEHLKIYPYCGHSRILAAKPEAWQARLPVLERFDQKESAAQLKYAAFVAEGISLGKRPEFAGGGLIRSAGGWQEVDSAYRAGIFLKSDERILGDSDFVEAVLDAVEEQRICCHGKVSNLKDVAERVAEVLHVTTEEVFQSGKSPAAVKSRSLLCYWATRDVGMTTTAVAIELGLCQSAVSRAAQRGEVIAKKQGWDLGTGRKT